jgi:hypothetical protein
MHKIESAGSLFSMTYVPEMNMVVVVVVVVIIIISTTTTFMQGIYTYIPATKHDSRESVATIL